MSLTEEIDHSIRIEPRVAPGNRAQCDIVCDWEEEGGGLQSGGPDLAWGRGRFQRPSEQLVLE